MIEDIGCQAMAVLFGGKGADSLAKMRYSNFSKNIVSASSFVTPEHLPPTESATKLHSHRVYFQIIVWIEKKRVWMP